MMTSAQFRDLLREAITALLIALVVLSAVIRVNPVMASNGAQSHFALCLPSGDTPEPKPIDAPCDHCVLCGPTGAPALSLIWRAPDFSTFSRSGLGHIDARIGMVRIALPFATGPPV